MQKLGDTVTQRILNHVGIGAHVATWSGCIPPKVDKILSITIKVYLIAKHIWRYDAEEVTQCITLHFPYTNPPHCVYNGRAEDDKAKVERHGEGLS